MDFYNVIFLNSNKSMIQKWMIVTALKIALIVGLILNIINQGELIFTLNFSQINYFKVLLTFFVPFGVSLYSSYKAQSRQ